MTATSTTLALDRTVSPEEQALFLLGGFECSICSKAFRETVIPKLGEKGYREGRPPEAYDGHICCRTIHCPFCGEPASAKCVHILAQRTNTKHWVFPGITMQTGVPSTDTASQFWQMLVPSQEELVDCFGDLALLCARFYEPEVNSQVILSEYFLAQMHWSNCQATWVGSGWRYIRFAIDAAEHRALVRKTMHRIRAGFRRWQQTYLPRSIHAARFLPRYQYQDAFQRTSPTIAALDSSRRFLMAVAGNRSALWDLNSSQAPVAPDLNAGENYRNYRAARFTDFRFQISSLEGHYRIRYTARTPDSAEDTIDLPTDAIHYLEQSYEKTGRRPRNTIQSREIVPPYYASGEWTAILPASVSALELPSTHCRVRLTDNDRLLTVERTDTSQIEQFRFRTPVTNLQAADNHLILITGGRVAVWQMAVPGRWQCQADGSARQMAVPGG